MKFSLTYIQESILEKKKKKKVTYEQGAQGKTCTYKSKDLSQTSVAFQDENSSCIFRLFMKIEIIELLKNNHIFVYHSEQIIKP